MTANGGETKRERTTNLLLSTDEPEEVYQILSNGEKYQDPEEIFFNGEIYFCPDKRCSTRGKEPEDVSFHIEQTHDRTLKEHFIDHFKELKVARKTWVRHEELLEEYSEKIDHKVMEASTFIHKFEHGNAVCAICKELCEDAKQMKKHKKVTGHNIWFRRLETPKGYKDPVLNE
jgi:hypothetical protein